MHTDVLHNVMMHLRPWYMLNLLCTNKKINRDTLDNNEYFERLAVYMAYHREIVPSPKRIYRHMVNLPMGYNNAMNDFGQFICELLRKKIRGETVPTLMSALGLVERLNYVFDKEEYGSASDDEDENEETPIEIPQYTSALEYVKMQHVKIHEDCVVSYDRELYGLRMYLNEEKRLTFEQKRTLAQSITDLFPRKISTDDDATTVHEKIYKGLSKQYDSLMMSLTFWSCEMLQNNNEIPMDIVGHVIKTVYSFVNRMMVLKMKVKDHTMTSIYTDLLLAKGESFMAMRNTIRDMICPLEHQDE